MAKKPRCKHCKKPFERTFTTTQAVCSPFCGLKLAAIKRNKKYDQITKQKKKKLRESDLSHQITLTQKTFNKMRKLEELKWYRDRGLEPECISCGKTNMDWCCGHFKTTGAQGGLRFDRKNSYLQCNRYCNKGLSGNISGNKNTRGYIQGLTDRFGQGKADSIIRYCEANTQPVKWTCDQLISMRKGFSKRIRELEIDQENLC